MVVSTPERTRKHLLGKYPLVPYADDGPLAKAACERILSEQAMMTGPAGEALPESLAEIDKHRPRWAQELKTARYRDMFPPKPDEGQ